MIRSTFIGGIAAVLTVLQSPAAVASQAKKGVLLMNRIGPTSAVLYIADADGGNERKLLPESGLDYHASFSADGKWIVFTSEREGRGQADIYRVRADGSQLERLTDHPAVDDQAVISPDGRFVAFVSTRESPTNNANIWVLDLKTRKLRNLTGHLPAADDKPNGFFRPSWSPDGKWIAFSSDRNTDWHARENGWEHVQELAIYVIGVDGKNLRKIASKAGHALGSPKWSPDGKRLIFYETTIEGTWWARRPELVANAVSQIVSVDVETGERIEHTSGPGFKMAPQFVNGGIAYLIKGGALEGLYHTNVKGLMKKTENVRSPTWSNDGSQVIYEKVDFTPYRRWLPLYSWDKDWDYRHMDVFPMLSRQNKLVFTRKAVDSSIVISDADGSNERVVFDTALSLLDVSKKNMGLAGAFQPTWSPDGEWIAFGLGYWFGERRYQPARIMRIRVDGTGLEALTDGTIHCGYPSYAPDGKRIVYRVYSEKEKGLRILDLETRQTTVLTTGYDNTPDWNPDGSRIVFTRKVDPVNYDVFTIRPDGTDLKRLTTHPSSDAHAVWSRDGKHVLFSGSRHGFRDEASLYDRTFQQYGQIYIMNADGSDQRMLTDSPWEDSMPLFIPYQN